MHFDFLAASDGTPLTKSFSIDASTKELKRGDYPLVWRFDSVRIEVNNVKQLAMAIQTAGKTGQCLLKGLLDRDLKDESRAKHTDSSEPTEWICLDIDGVPEMSIDKFMEVTSLNKVQHVVQYSASSGVVKDRGLSAHVFVMLDKPVAPDVLKTWLMDLNCEIPELRAACRLSRTNNTVRWALDVSTCQNDKLIYVAPPILGKGVKSTIKLEERVYAVTKGVPKLAWKETCEFAVVNTKAKKLLNELRVAKGLDRRDVTTRIVHGVEVMKSPTKASVTSSRTERGFVYLNLNGGDSWGYYHPTDNPKIIYNFKGEPNYLTEQLLPDYYKRACADLRPTGVSQEDEGSYYLAFLDPVEDVYYRGIWRPDVNEININPTRHLKKLQDFLVANGQAQTEFVPEWRYEFRPDISTLVLPDERFVNRFHAAAMTMPAATAPSVCPPRIEALMRHIVSNDERCFRHLLNWVAVIYKQRCRTNTAWLFRGTEGVGKGAFYNRVLRPLLGERHCTIIRFSDLEEKFNEFLSSSLFVFVDEVYYKAVKDYEGLMQRFRNYIVEPTIPIRAMRIGVHNVRNFCNFGMSSNYLDALQLRAKDRRVNTAPYQNQPYKLTLQDLEAIEAEVPAFAAFLMTLSESKQEAGEVLDTEDRQEMHQATSNSIDVAVQALKTGNLGFFCDQLPSDEGNLISNDPTAPLKLNVYRAFLKEAYEGAKLYPNELHKISREQLMTLFEFVVGNTPNTPNKFTSYLRHHDLTLSRIRLPPERGGGLAYGCTTKWTIDEASTERLESRPATQSTMGQQTPVSTVTPITKARGKAK